MARARTTAAGPADDDRLPARPALKAGLCRVWRDATTLQLGLGPTGTVVHDVDPAVAALIDRLDGTLPRDELPRAAAEVGLGADDATDLVRRLHAHGVLDDAAASTRSARPLTAAERDRLAPDLAAWGLRDAQHGSAPDVHARRRAARVRVHGAGRVGALAAALLAHAGIGWLDVVDPDPLRAGDVPAPWARAAPPDSVGAPARADVALDVCEQLTPSLRTSRRRAAGRSGRRSVDADLPPTVALLAPVGTHGTVDLEVRDDLVRAGVPHLPAYVRGEVGVVGPFVVPGRTPCLRCVDLVRTDRDPAWPRILAQLTPPPGRVSPRRAALEASDGVVATVVAAQAVLQVLAHVDGGRPSATAATVETGALDGLTRLRSWPAHPACGCMWSASTRTHDDG